MKFFIQKLENYIEYDNHKCMKEKLKGLSPESTGFNPQ
jgi:hypothetical protein